MRQNTRGRVPPLASILFAAATALALGPLAAQVPDSALLASFKWRNIGPANMGGRIVDIEAVESSFRIQHGWAHCGY